MKKYEQLQGENHYLKQLLVRLMHNQTLTDTSKIVTKKSSIEEKITLLKSLFKGRKDVYAQHWESANGSHGYTPVCALEWKKPFCQKPLIKCNQCQQRKLLSLTDQVLIEHIEGRKTIGIYPLLHDNKCSFLAVDFDKKQWQQDVLAFSKTCIELKIPCHIERSRSGNGAHVWIFFSSPVLAEIARKLGMVLLRKTQEENEGFYLESFDRLFPNQDIMPKGGFGNLIALPLQKAPAQSGNSLFVDENFITYPDQWLYLSTVRKIKERDIQNVIQADVNSHLSLPKEIQIELKNGIHIKKNDIPISLVSQMMEITSFNNPRFYRARAKRLSTYEIPRMVQCAIDEQDVLILPRGCLEELLALFADYSIKVNVIDQQYSGENFEVKFHGVLSSHQDEVVKKLLEVNQGVLSATTGFGKTVVATAIIAERRVNTLVVVHRTHLMKQWIEKLSSFLKIPLDEIGQIGGGKNKISGKVDVATIQSLNHKGELKSFITRYGQIIVDECHIIPAITFENVLKKIRPKYLLGLTATPKRKDGMHPIIMMQCGAICYTIDAKSQAKVRPFGHRLILRETNFITKKTEFHEIYEELASNTKRNLQIFDDVLRSIEEGRSPIILTERIEHLELLKKQFSGFVKNVIVLAGSMKKKDQKNELERLSTIPKDEECLVIATGKYIGEGFDNARLDTLFLTMPISWKGTLQQYVGRLHRHYDSKEEVQVYDYVDEKVPFLKKMYEKRLAGYKSMGYCIGDSGQVTEQMRLF